MKVQFMLSADAKDDRGDPQAVIRTIQKNVGEGECEDCLEMSECKRFPQINQAKWGWMNMTKTICSLHDRSPKQRERDMMCFNKLAIENGSKGDENLI